MTSAHQDRAHAVLSASSSKQWLNCPPSIRASSGISETTNEAALLGTYAHELSELYFANKFQGMDDKTFNVTYKAKVNSAAGKKYHSRELEDYVLEYVDFVTERVNVAKARDEASLKLMFERPLDLTTYVPEAFGTGDVIIYSGGVLEIIDLKYGKREVYAQNNSQLRLYALGAAEELEIDCLEDIQEISMWIYQPRRNLITNEELSYDQLKAWGIQYVKPRAELAFKGEGEYKSGSHCEWCKIKQVCKTRAEDMQKTVADMKDPNILSNDEISELLFKVDDIAKWAKDIKDYALMKACDNESFEGWKLVAGRSRRAITNVEDAEAVLSLEFSEEDIKEPAKLKSISALEKSLGKKTVEAFIGHLIIKPEGAPTLVQESDKRPSINNSIEFEILEEK